MALSVEAISTLVEQIATIHESSIPTTSVLERLDSFGYEVSESDAFAIAFSVQKVEQSIKNICNIDDIPDGLMCHAVDMVCGEFLSVKHKTGQLTVGTLNLDGALSSVTVGDTAVSFNDGTSDDNKFAALITALANSGRGELVCYRKIKW